MRLFQSILSLITFGVLAVSGYTLKGPGHDESISYALITTQEQLHSLPAGHEDYHGYPDLKHDVVQMDANKHQEHQDYHGPAKYEFSYGVKDPMTGDIKTHWELRDGDSVKGGYSLKDADGTTRIVHYTADHKKGFEAVVHRISDNHEQKHVNVPHKEHSNRFLIMAGH